jgi:hypothetical protein
MKIISQLFNKIINERINHRFHHNLYNSLIKALKKFRKRLLEKYVLFLYPMHEIAINQKVLLYFQTILIRHYLMFKCNK